MMAADEKLFGLLTVCRRAGRMEMGFDSVKEAVMQHKAYLILEACDISPKTEKEIAFAAEKIESKADIVRIDADKAAVGEKLGKPAAVMAVCDKGFAGKAKEILSAEGNSAENTINQ